MVTGSTKQSKLVTTVHTVGTLQSNCNGSHKYVYFVEYNWLHNDQSDPSVVFTEISNWSIQLLITQIKSGDQDTYLKRYVLQYSPKY